MLFSKEYYVLTSSMKPAVMGRAGKLDWTFQVDLTAWRTKGGSACREKLRMYKDTTKEEAKALADRVGTNVILHITGKKRNDKIAVDKILEYNCKDILLEELQEENLPDSFTDETMGVFELDDLCIVYEQSAQLGNSTVTFHLPVGSPERDEALALLRKLKASIETWDQKAKSFAAQSLIGLKNQSWPDEEEKGQTISETEFCSRLKLDTLSVHDDDNYTLWYDGTDLFGGHFIKVCGSSSQGFSDAQLEG